ncbi:MAG: dicarboxylate/amino acid:cation symporter [Treponema sp.]|nr:dicarboxylate/amino acid:cation symporter [Treponema sp.]
MIVFATRNSMATLPSAITSLDDRMGFDKNTVNLMMPLGITLGRFGAHPCLQKITRQWPVAAPCRYWHTHR